MKRKLNIKKFKNFEEQEQADIRYYKNLSYEKKLEEIEQIRKFHLKLKYGDIPRLRRTARIIKKK